MPSPLVLASCFSGRDCARVLALGRALPKHRGETVVPTENYRSGSIAWIERTAKNDWLHDLLWEIGQVANASYRFELAGFREPLQFSEYAPGNHIKWHADAGAGFISTRKLSISIQLTDEGDYAGGGLEFCPGGEPLLSRNRGTAIVFPSYMPHRVTRVKSGVRHSLVAWIHGPPFR